MSESKPKTSAQRKAEQRERDKKQGLVDATVKIPNTSAARKALKEFAADLRRQMKVPPPEDLIL